MISPPSISGVISIPSIVPQSFFANHRILGHIHESAGEITGIGGLESGVGKALARAVGRNEVLQHRQPFAEIRRDRSLDNFTGRFRHQSTHTGQLANLLRAAAGAGVGHHENRIKARHRNLPARLIGHFFRTQIAQHFIGDSVGDLRPNIDDFVVAFAVGDQTVLVLLLDLAHIVMGLLEQLLFARRNHHVFNGNRNTRLGGISIADVFQPIGQE